MIWKIKNCVNFINKCETAQQLGQKYPPKNNNKALKIKN